MVDGRAAATDLGVTERTIRRYAVALHDIGIPVDGQPGVGGGYRLRAGTRLPPLMFYDDEATAVALGLVIAERRGIGAGERSPKITRVLPARLARRIERLRDELSFSASRAGAADLERDAARVAEAVRRRRSPRDRLHARRRHAEYARDRAARSRRASRTLVRPCARPHERRAAHVPRRPHRPRRDRRAGAASAIPASTRPRTSSRCSRACRTSGGSRCTSTRRSTSSPPRPAVARPS